MNSYYFSLHILHLELSHPVLVCSLKNDCVLAKLFEVVVSIQQHFLLAEWIRMGQVEEVLDGGVSTSWRAVCSRWLWP